MATYTDPTHLVIVDRHFTELGLAFVPKPNPSLWVMINVDTFSKEARILPELDSRDVLKNGAIRKRGHSIGPEGYSLGSAGDPQAKKAEISPGHDG